MEERDRAETASKNRAGMSTPFVFILLLTFAVTAICTLLVGVVIYRNIGERVDGRYGTSTPLFYISAKIRAHDTAADGRNSVSIGEIDGIPALVLLEDYGCVTYIYVYEGTLRELYMSEGAGLGADEGSIVTPCAKMALQMKENTLTATLTNAGGDVHSVSVTLMAVTEREAAA